MIDQQRLEEIRKRCADQPADGYIDARNLVEEVERLRSEIQFVMTVAVEMRNSPPSSEPRDRFARLAEHLYKALNPDPSTTPPTWTRTPPSEPGFYFIRDAKGVLTVAERTTRTGGWQWYWVAMDEGSSTKEMIANGYEFWPIHITPPEVK